MLTAEFVFEKPRLMNFESVFQITIGLLFIKVECFRAFSEVKFLPFSPTF